MKEFTYKIKDEVGIHARPAGYLAKKSKEFESVVTIEKNGKKPRIFSFPHRLARRVSCGKDNASFEVRREKQWKIFTPKSFPNFHNSPPPCCQQRRKCVRNLEISGEIRENLSSGG